MVEPNADSFKGRRRATLRELASELDLSVTTVSRALGGHSDVAERTRQRVSEAADRLNYVPNSAGKMLVTGRSSFVSLLLPIQNPILDPFLGEFVTGLSEGLAGTGRHLSLATAPSAESEVSVLRQIVESGQADGVILTRIAEYDERVEFLLDRDFPFVTHGRTSRHQQDYSWIDTDGQAAFMEACDLLYEAGHRDFGLVSIEERVTFRSERERGLELAMAAANDSRVTLSTCHVPRFDLAARTAAISSMLASSDRPSAILALTDELALSVLSQAHVMGIRVPDELSVIGFDNLPAAHYAPPGLTTFDQCIRQTACDMAQMLLDHLDAVSTRQQRLIKARLVKRGSHGPWSRT